ncbi:MAG: hypothetical protein ABW061_27145, partial [Polyangiaceae bacterium]
LLARCGGIRSGAAVQRIRIRLSHSETAQKTAREYALSVLGALATVGLLGLAACPADIANPGDYNHPGSASAGTSAGGSGASAGSAGAGGASTQPGLNVPTTCLTAVLAKSCGTLGCHQAPATFAAGLDLSSPNVNTRLIDVVATHKDADPASGCVVGQKLIDSVNPDQSWLVLKLSTDGTSCGYSMPIGSSLSADDTACLKQYAQDVAAATKAGGH